MLRISFYEEITSSKPVEVYEGSKLEVDHDWTGQEIRLDGNLIATFRQCYEFSYFMLTIDYNKPNYQPGDARWLAKMTVEEESAK